MKEMQYDPLPLCTCDHVTEPHYHQGGMPMTCYGDTLAGWKSLSNAEAAAEYWKARNNWIETNMRATNPHLNYRPSVATTRAEMLTMHRFATHPHAREGDYE